MRGILHPGAGRGSVPRSGMGPSWDQSSVSRSTGSCELRVLAAVASPDLRVGKRATWFPANRRDDVVPGGSEADRSAVQCSLRLRRDDRFVQFRGTVDRVTRDRSQLTGRGAEYHCRMTGWGSTVQRHRSRIPSVHFDPLLGCRTIPDDVTDRTHCYPTSEDIPRARSMVTEVFIFLAPSRQLVVPDESVAAASDPNAAIDSALPRSPRLAENRSNRSIRGERLTGRPIRD